MARCAGAVAKPETAAELPHVRANTIRAAVERSVPLLQRIAPQFYEKSGWHLAGTFVIASETSNGPFPVEQWRYEKQLTRST